ncbi:MAG: hypothetical protein WC215_04045 [Bacilli bacterium]
MKKALQKFAILCAASIVTIGVSGCNDVVDLSKIYFTRNSQLTSQFGGLGVEWGAYEDTNKITEDAWVRVLDHVDRLKPAKIRLMINYDWFCQNFDNQGNDNREDDTWTYNFSNKWMDNTIEILTYCQENNIQVAFGAWNVIGSMSDDVWDMMEDVSSDIRWAKITGDVLDYLVYKKGFTCIRYFVNTNEPNYRGIQGASKNYNNTYEKWEQGVRNVRAKLDELGLTNIGIVGGDTTGLTGSVEYLGGISKNIPTLVGDYGVHMYVSNYYIDTGMLEGQIRDIYNMVKDNDSRLGDSIQANIWEAGLVDGKDVASDCNALIDTYNYGLRMADYTIQCVLAGINSIVYWDLDDAMHFMYRADGTSNAKEWGMFSSLTAAPASKQELRPWYHSSVLMTNLFRPDDLVYSSKTNDVVRDNSFRAIAAVSKDKTRGGIAAVNRGMQTVSKTFAIEEEIVGAEEIYVYTYNEKTLRLGSDGYVIPNRVISGSLNRRITVDIPANTLLVLSTVRL